MSNRAYQWIVHHKIEVAIILLIVAGGGFLRLYHAGDWMHFGQDEGRDAFIISDITQNFHVKLLGPAAPNNSPDFHLGPTFYYLLVPFYWIGGASPGAGATAIALFSAASIFLVYCAGKRFFGTAAGIVSAALYAVSFLMLYYGRWAWNPNVVPFFILALFILLYELSKNRGSRQARWFLYALAACAGIVMQLHGTALIVVPVILVLFFVMYRPKFLWKQYVIALFVFIVSNIPLVIYDLTNNFANAKGFFRIMTQSESGAVISFVQRIRRTIEGFSDFWHEGLLHSRMGVVFTLLAIILFVFIAVQTWNAVRSRKKNSAVGLFALWLLVPVCIFVFYKEAIPVHYYCIVFPVPFLAAGWFVGWLWKRNIFREIIVLLVCIVLVWQATFSIQLLSDLAPDGSRDSSYPVTLTDMEQVVDFVRSDANGELFNFSCEPAGRYTRSFEYLFESADVASSYVSVPRKYIAAINGEWTLPAEYANDIVTTTIFNKVTLYSLNQG